MIAFKANTAAPLQEQIADHLAHRIVSGELPDKSRLPSTVELARLYHVTPVTIHKSLQHLVQRQLIERQPRRGTFVRSRERVRSATGATSIRSCSTNSRSSRSNAPST